MIQMRKGATFIEYALLVGLVAIVVAAAAMFFGQDLKRLFSESGAQAQDVAEKVSKVTFTVDATKAESSKGGGGKQQQGK